jgi:endo-1,4-beta-xylanase
LLSAALAATLTGSCSWSATLVHGGAPYLRVDRPPEPSTSLNEIAARKGIFYGSCAGYRRLSTDPGYQKAFATQCGLLVPETELTWEVVRPTVDSYNFAAADWLFRFTQDRGLKFRGHALVWHGALPQWFESQINPANAREILLDHIAKVVGRYSGKMQSWTVVNEVIFPDDRRSDGLRNSPWLRLLGTAYIETAFRAAAKADPNALLMWNENWVEEETADGEARRSSLLQQLRALLKKNVPIHVVGIQAHLIGGHTNIAGARFARFLRQIGELGLKIMVTELDVRDFALPADVTARDRIIAETYEHFLSIVLAEKATIGVLTWGLTDRYTWVATANPRGDKAPVRPLPLDYDMNPSPAWFAIARAFKETPYRSSGTAAELQR